uniref:Uncharacterized protein n=1 Tax=Anguilla anguilla TaxID=7936 RepID=A0A0E9WE01_ANGAN
MAFRLRKKYNTVDTFLLLTVIFN